MVKTYMAIGSYVGNRYVSAREIAQSYELDLKMGILVDNKSKTNTLEAIEGSRKEVNHSQRIPVLRPNSRKHTIKAKKEESEKFETHSVVLLGSLLTVFFCWLTILGIMVNNG